MSTTAVHGRKATILIDGYLVSQLLHSIRLPLNRQDVDVSVFGDDDAESISGLRNGVLNFEGFRMADRDSYQMLLAETQGILSNTNHICTYIPDGDAFGNFAHIFQSQESSIEVGAPLNSAVMLSGVFNATGGTRPAVVLNAALGGSAFTQSQVQQVVFNSVSGTATMLDGLGNTWSMTPGDSAGTVQTAARANGNSNYSAVVVTGSSTAYSGGNVVVSGLTGGYTGYNGTYVDTGTFQGARYYQLDGTHYMFWDTSASKWTIYSSLTNPGSGSIMNNNAAINAVPTGSWVDGGQGLGLTMSSTSTGSSGGNGTYLFTFPGAAGNQPTIGSNTAGVSAQLLVQGGVIGNRNIIIATGTGTSVDGGAATTNGYTINLNAINVAGTTPSMTVIVEDSPDNGTWSTVATFTAVTAKGAQRLQSKTATVHRYTRVRWTVTGTLPQFAVNVSLSRFGDIIAT